MCWLQWWIRSECEVRRGGVGLDRERGKVFDCLELLRSVIVAS